MSGAGFILAINLFIAGLIAAAFMAIAAHDRRLKAARWMALGYGLGIANPLIEFGIATFGDSRLAVVSAFAMLLAAMAVLNVGIARRYEASAPWTTMLIVFVISVVACYFIQDMPRHSFTRMLLYQSPYFIMQAIAVGIVGQARQRSSLDNFLMALLALSALQFLSKPFWSMMLGGSGASPQDYLGTNYALVSQSMGTVFALAVALTLLVVLVRDLLSDAALRSETDMLSGLLNRGGFEKQAELAIQAAVRLGASISLVISDLDRFKAINDTFGHASGDRVIVNFAAFIRATIAEHHLAGRIGGEEFAVLLPGANVVAARLFAESARNSFPAMAIEGLPESRRVTASYGVAEWVSGESFPELFARADKALYLAKDSGRDCVRIAPRPDMRRSGDRLDTAVSLG